MSDYLDASGMYSQGHGQAGPSHEANEATMLLAFLERQRATFAWKVSGLDSDELHQAHPPSVMTLGGMLKHLARFEDDMSHEWILGQAQLAPWNKIDWATDGAWDWRTGATEEPALLYSRWREAVDRSRAIIQRAVASGEPGIVSAPLRYVLLNMIEEYARHNGHADLIRESIDGLVGHDPPE